MKDLNKTMKKSFADAVKKGRTGVSPNSDILNQLSELAGKEGSEEEETTVL